MSRFFQRRPRGEGTTSGGIVPGGSPGDANGPTDWRRYDAAAANYERSAPIMQPPARDLVALAAPPPGGRALDVGTGTGIALEALGETVGPNGLAVGADVSLGMLAAGRGARPGLWFVGADAIDLPFRDASFDVVTANFVIAHFKRYQTALFDLIRVLRPGGRLAVTAWAAGDDEFTKTWRGLLEEAVGHDLLVDAYRQAQPWRDQFSDRRNVEAALREAGLYPVRVEVREYRAQIGREDYLVVTSGTVGGRFARQMLGDESFARLMDRARQAFAERFPDPLTDFRDVILAVGTKPESWVAGRAQGR